MRVKLEQLLADFDHLGIFRFAMLQRFLLYRQFPEIESAVPCHEQIVSALQGVESVEQQRKGIVHFVQAPEQLRGFFLPIQFLKIFLYQIFVAAPVPARLNLGMNHPLLLNVRFVREAFGELVECSGQ